MKPPENVEKKHLLHLTGFRAIAAYFVLIGHCVDTVFLYNGVPVGHAYVSGLTYLGMSIFFVLSGFVITYTYYDRFIQLPWRQATRDFAVARFARLYPLYIFLLLFDRDYYKPLFRHGTLSEILSYFTLTQSWWNVDGLTFGTTWSISTECFFYLCFALWMLFPSETRRTATYVRRWAVITLAGILLLLAAVYAHRADVTAFLFPFLSHASGGDVWGWFKYLSPYVRVGEFIAGVCAARMFMVTRHDAHLAVHSWRASMLCIGSGLAIIALVICNCGGFAPDSFLFFLSQNFGYAPFLAYIFYACSRYPNLLTRWCSTPVMQTGGEISYSLYMLQFWLYYHVLPDPVAQSPSQLAYEVSFLKMILYIILITIASLCSYHLVEVPSRRFLRRWLA